MPGWVKLSFSSRASAKALVQQAELVRSLSPLPLLRMNASTYFDRRGPTYDADQTHRRISTILVSGAPLQPGMRVLDIATGTGAAALKAAEIVGSQGSVLGIDISDGMLVEARRKAMAAGPRM